MTVLRTQRVLGAPPEAVFAAIADPERLARWWGPTGFSNHFEAFDFRPGGHWRFVMRGPDGAEYPNLNQFTEIEPDVRVCIRHLSAPLFTLSLTLTPQGAGTLLHWAQAFDDPQVGEQLRPICEPANEQNLDRLARETG